MDRETMLKRLEAGYDPIDVSIEKWKDGVNLGSCDNCALCEKFLRTESVEIGCVCARCPLYIYSGYKCNDNDSMFTRVYNNGNPDTKVFIEFLREVKDDMKRKEGNGDDLYTRELEPEPVYRKVSLGTVAEYRDHRFMIVGWNNNAHLITIDTGMFWSGNDIFHVDNPCDITRDELRKILCSANKDVEFFDNLDDMNSNMNGFTIEDVRL